MRPIYVRYPSPNWLKANTHKIYSSKYMYYCYLQKRIRAIEIIHLFLCTFCKIYTFSVNFALFCIKTLLSVLLTPFSAKCTRVCILYTFLVKFTLFSVNFTIFSVKCLHIFSIKTSRKQNTERGRQRQRVNCRP